jgi:hypothetical protein
MSNFRHSVVEYSGGFEFGKFQMLKCPKCDHILYWAESTKTNVAKLFEDYSKLRQYEILIDLCNEDDDGDDYEY